VLHCTFGAVLQTPSLSAPLRELIEANSSDYQEILADHFSRHLLALAHG
jgi:hypothetical protein